MSKQTQMVSVLHKCDPSSLAGKAPGATARLAVGQTFRFPGSGDRYTVQPDGSVRNADPKAYHGKAGRKLLLAERRASREVAMTAKEGSATL